MDTGHVDDVAVAVDAVDDKIVLWKILPFRAHSRQVHENLRLAISRACTESDRLAAVNRPTVGCAR